MSDLSRLPVSQIFRCYLYFKFIFISMLFLGGSVEGVRRGSPWTGPYSSPWTRSVWGSMDRGGQCFGSPINNKNMGGAKTVPCGTPS